MVSEVQSREELLNEVRLYAVISWYPRGIINAGIINPRINAGIIPSIP